MNLLHKSAASRVLAKGTPRQGTIVGLHVWESGGGEDSPDILHEAYAVEADGRLFAVHQNLEPLARAADHEGGLGGCDDDAEFEFALDLIVEGLARRVA